MGARTRQARPFVSWGLFLWCSLAGAASVYSQDDPATGSPWEGRDIFREKGCINCHAVYGEGGERGPDLGERRFYGTHLELSALMWNHLPQMLREMRKTGYGYPRFNRHEMKQLVAYLAQMRYIADRGNANNGRKLLKSKRCMACHRFGGVGGDVGPDITTNKDYLTPIMLVEAMWNHGPTMMDYFEDRNLKPPKFKRDEIVDLATGVRSYMTPTRVAVGSHEIGDANRGKRLCEEKGCMNCHAVDGIGRARGPDFSKLDFDCSATEIAGRMWNHGPKMWEAMKEEGMEFPTFEGGEIAHVVAYLYGLKLKDEPGRVENGRAIVERDCLSCHSLGSSGAGHAPDLSALGPMESPLDLVASMWNHAPEMRKAQLDVKLQWPRLDGGDMAELYAFLQSRSNTPKAANQ